MSRAGRKSFERCDVKVVEIKDHVYTDDTKDTDVLSPNPSEDSRLYAGSAAVLHCPRTEDDRVNVESQYSNHSSRLQALESVKALAGELLCRDCIFSGMSPVEVSIHRRDLAKAETERLIAYQALEAARSDLDAVSPPHLLEGGSTL